MTRENSAHRFLDKVHEQRRARLWRGEPVDMLRWGTYDPTSRDPDGWKLFAVVTPDGTVVYGTGYAYPAYIGDVWYEPPLTYGVEAQPIYNPAVGYAAQVDRLGVGHGAGDHAGHQDMHAMPAKSCRHCTLFR